MWEPQAWEALILVLTPAGALLAMELLSPQARRNRALRRRRQRAERALVRRLRAW